MGRQFEKVTHQWVDNHLREYGGNNSSGLRPPDYLVLTVLIRHLNRTTGTAWPSEETIAIKAGIPLRTVQRCIARLKKQGKIEVERHQRNHGRKGVHNSYRLLYRQNGG